MPNWCANRLRVTGLAENVSQVRGLMRGEVRPAYARAEGEGAAPTGGISSVRDNEVASLRLFCRFPSCGRKPAGIKCRALTVAGPLRLQGKLRRPAHPFPAVRGTFSPLRRRVRLARPPLPAPLYARLCGGHGTTGVPPDTQEHNYVPIYAW